MSPIHLPITKRKKHQKAPVNIRSNQSMPPQPAHNTVGYPIGMPCVASVPTLYYIAVDEILEDANSCVDQCELSSWIKGT